MSDTLFTNVRIFDGGGEAPFTGDVLVQGNRINRVVPTRYGQTSPPVLLVTGDEDGVAPPQAVRSMADRLHASRSKRVVVLPRCGHWTPVERPDECQRELRDFLAAQARS